MGNQNIGVSRGRKSTKIHALVNEHFQLIGVDLTGGNVHDSEVVIKLLSKVALKGKKFWLIRLFAQKKFANIFLTRKLPPVFQTSQMLSIFMFLTKNFTKQGIRRKVFQRIKIFSHIVTRYDKLFDCFLNFVFLASVMILI